jgi:Ribulose bisphosphate carboxylase large chain, N-terminal domain
MTISLRSSMLALAMAGGLVLPAAAQTASQSGTSTWTAIQQLQADLQTDRQALVAENMPLNEAEARAFWPVYKAYAADLGKAGDRKASIIAAYAANFDSMNDVKADAFMKDYLTMEDERLKTRKKYAQEATKVLGAQKAARWMQIETKLDAIINMGIASEIPLVPLKK